MARENRITDLRETLSELEFSVHDDPIGMGEGKERLADAATRILELAGYDERHLYTDVTVEIADEVESTADAYGLESLLFDAVAAEDPQSPHIAIHADYIGAPTHTTDDGFYLDQSSQEIFTMCARSCDAEIPLILSNGFLAYTTSDGRNHGFMFSDLSDDNLEMVLEDLSPPPSYE